MPWVSTLANISIWIILIPLIIGLLRYRMLNRDSKLIVLVVIAGTIPQVLRPFDNNTQLLFLLYNLYTPIEFILYFWLFRKRAKFNFTKRFMLLSFILFSIASIYFVLNNRISERFINEWVIINNAIQISWICGCLMEYYRNDNSSIELNEPFFWFLLGITIYSSGTIVFYGLWHFMHSKSGIQEDLIKLIHHIFNILLYVCFTIGLLKNQRTASA